MTYSFLELLIFFGLTLDISCLKFISHPTKEILCVNTNFMGNQSLSKTKHFHLFLILMLKNVFFNVKLKFLINYNFSQFHKHIFRRSRTHMFFKVGVLENFAIFRIKERLEHRKFFCKKQPLGGLLKKRYSFLQANV